MKRTRPFLALTAAASIAGFAVSGRAEIIEQVLVKVNGEILSKTELETRQVSALRQLGRLNEKERPTDAQLREMLSEVTPRLLVNAVDEMLLIQRGKELGFRLTDEQFNTFIENIKKDNKIQTDEQFQAALKQEGMTLADLRRSFERQRLAFMVRQREVIERLSVSDEESRRYYDAHLSEFTTPPAVTLREVLVSVPADADEANIAAARQKAADIRGRAVAGEAFDKLASELSDSPSKANAGLVGPINVADLSAEVKAVIEPLKTGDVSGVLHTPTGFLILKVETLSATATVPFSQAREEIAEKVFETKQLEEFRKYIDRLRSQAIIEWKSPELQKAYEQGLKQGAGPEA